MLFIIALSYVAIGSLLSAGLAVAIAADHNLRPKLAFAAGAHDRSHPHDPLDLGRRPAYTALTLLLLIKIGLASANNVVMLRSNSQGIFDLCARPI